MHHHHLAIYMEAIRNRRHPATMHLFLDVLAPAIFSDNPRPILDFCFAKRLLARNKVCPACFVNMRLVPRRQLTDKLAWHCRDNLCGSRSYHSVRAGSFFAKSRVPVKKAVHLIYLWAQESSVKAAADTLDVSRQCVQQHFQFLREVCSTHLLATPMFLGGRNVIVQIDESLFKHKPKYHRGRAPASEQWVFGICDTSTTPGVTYMEIVPDRRAQTLIPIIERVVRHGSIIHSDQWAAYRQLSANVNYTYATVNHSVNFVDPVTGVHTQAIKSYWAKAKNKFKAMKGVATPQLAEYLDERMWRDRYAPDATAAFHHICSHIHDVYPV